MRRMWLVWGALAWTLPALASAGETITYTYNAQGRMTIADHSGTVNDGLKSRYFYDDAGNRSEVKVTGSGHSSPPVAKPTQVRH